MTSAASRQLTHPTTLAAGQPAEIRKLALAVEDLDGAEPLNEHTLLHLSSTGGTSTAGTSVAGPGLAHILVTKDSAVIGYAQFEPGAPATAEVLVGVGMDRDRRVDLADELFVAAETLSGDEGLLVWGRGASPVTDAARRRGYSEDRSLLTMRRSLAGLDGSDTRPLATPPGITIRSFAPGRDDAAWLEINAAAFATHPEQGRWTQSDLDERLAQDWFDPAGFLLATDDSGALLGYHWTKVHAPTRAGEPPLAEVYVLGISPSAQGRGLGGVLLDAGLRHLAAGPAHDVILYVEQANAAAVGLYDRDGFVVDRRDVQFRRPTASPAPDVRSA